MNIYILMLALFGGIVMTIMTVARGAFGVLDHRLCATATVIIALLLLSGCAAHEDRWDAGDTTLYTMYVAAGAIDTYSTSRFQYHDGITEQNPIVRGALGANPDTTALWTTFAMTATLNYFVARSLPRGWRDTYLLMWGVGHGVAANGNCNLLAERDDPCF